MGRRLGFNDPKPFLRRHFPHRDSKCCGPGALELHGDDEATQTAGPWTGAHQAQVIVTVVYKAGLTFSEHAAPAPWLHVRTTQGAWRTPVQRSWNLGAQHQPSAFFKAPQAAPTHNQGSEPVA